MLRPWRIVWEVLRARLGEGTLHFCVLTRTQSLGLRGNCVAEEKGSTLVDN